MPGVGSLAQNIGKSARIVCGESVLIGEDAINEFERLVALFDLSQESKPLILPNGEMFFSYFSKLEMNGDGKHKKINYSFEFMEDMLKEDQVKKQYTLQPDDTLKQIALKNKVGLDRIFKNNPDLLKKRNKLQSKEELTL
ncbi:MAG: LysM peptidoglycan-binding domain-containing protein [Oscillospiraceae bacterium]